MSRSNLSQALKLIDLEIKHPKRAENDNIFLWDEKSNSKICIVNNIQDRIDAYHLLYKIYIEKEFANPNVSKLWYSLFDAHEDTITLIAKQGDEVVGASTVVIDSAMGLPSDEIYHEELNHSRRKNKIAEIVSLGLSPSARNSKDLLMKLFNCVYIVAHRCFDISELVISVNPRHSAFYTKKLYFRIEGAKKYFQKVGGAEALLLKLDLNHLEHEFIYNKHKFKNSLLNLFKHAKDSQNEEIYFMENKKSMTKAEFNYLFQDKFFDKNLHFSHYNYIENQINQQQTQCSTIE